MKSTTPPLLQADEELLLLEAIDMSGLGNWAAVAEHVGTKSKEACKVCACCECFSVSLLLQDRLASC